MALKMTAFCISCSRSSIPEAGSLSISRTCSTAFRFSTTLRRLGRLAKWHKPSSTPGTTDMGFPINRFHVMAEESVIDAVARETGIPTDALDTLGDGHFVDDDIYEMTLTERDGDPVA